MTERDQKLVWAILRALQQHDGPMHETILHADAGMKVSPRPTMTEMDQALMFCDSQRWARSVCNPLGARKWSISDKGRAALVELES